VIKVQTNCVDIFEDLNLPFETYFSDYINHETVIHEEIEIIWVIKGNAIITVDEKEFLLSPQTVFLIYMYRKHSIKSEHNSIIVTYRLKKEYLHKNNLFFEKVNFVNRVYSFSELALKYKQVPLLIVEIIKCLISEEISDLNRYKIIGYYKMYIIDLYRIIMKERYLDVKNINFENYLNRIHTIIEYTYNNFKEKISLEKLAEITGVSLYRLSHFIKEALGISYQDFLQNVRFERALKLLKETKDSVVKIAEECGFSDYKYLNKLMGERFHMTPLKYRKKIIFCKECGQITEDLDGFIKELKLCLETLYEDSHFSNLAGLRNNLL
jgi:AraC-like DNA-binding protein